MRNIMADNSFIGLDKDNCTGKFFKPAAKQVIILFAQWGQYSMGQFDTILHEIYWQQIYGRKKDNGAGLQQFGVKSVIILQKFVAFFVMKCHTVLKQMVVSPKNMYRGFVTC